MESFNPEITHVKSLDYGSVQGAMDCNRIPQVTEMEVDNDDLLDSNKSIEKDIEIIDGDKVTAGCKQFTSETGSIVSEDFIAESLILISDDLSSGCQNALRHLEVEGCSSHSLDTPQGNVEIISINETELKTFIGCTANRRKTNFPSKESEGCKTPYTISTDSTVSLGSVGRIEKATSHSELSTEEHQQCSLCWKWSTSENLFKRHILWHFFIKNCSDGMESGIKCDGSVVNEKSLEELVRSYELQFRNSHDILCWNCHRNYEIHFTSHSPVNSESEQLKCPLCVNTFRCKIRLQIHMKVHSSRSPYECCICKLVYKNARLLINHMNKHYQFGASSNVCDTSHTVYPYGDADERNLETALCPKGKEDPCVANDPIGRTSRIERHKQSSIFSDVCNTSHNVYLSGRADERNFEIALSPKGEEDSSVTNHRFGRGSSTEEEDLLHSTSDAKTVNDSCISSFRKKFEDEEVASCNSSYGLAKEMISCLKVDRYVNNALDFMHDEGSSMTSVLQQLQNCINLAKGMRDSMTQSDQTCSTLGDLSELEAVLKRVMLTSYGSILADLDRSRFWCKICATPFQEFATFQIHKIKFCTGRKNKRELNHFKNKTAKSFQYKCFMCNKYFYNPLKRYDHMVFHFALLLKRCPVCTKHFESLRQFTDHLLTHPLMENNLLKCSDCNKYFCEEKAIAKHFQRAHSVRKPYRCETCNREFFKGSSFALHVKGHLRNKWRKSLVGMDMYKPPKQNLQKKEMMNW